MTMQTRREALASAGIFYHRSVAPIANVLLPNGRTLRSYTIRPVVSRFPSSTAAPARHTWWQPRNEALKTESTGKSGVRPGGARDLATRVAYQTADAAGGAARMCASFSGP